MSRPRIAETREGWIRRRILRALGRDGELPTPAIVAAMSGGTRNATAPEIEAALCDLAAAGVVDFRRALAPFRHGAKVNREWTYWRLSQ